MSDFFHDPTTDDQGDTYVVHSADGLTLELCPTCLTVRNRSERDAPALARVPLNLDRIVGVVAGNQITAHATHAHELVIRREPDCLTVVVRTQHHELLRRRLTLPRRAAQRDVAAAVTDVRTGATSPT